MIGAFLSVLTVTVAMAVLPPAAGAHGGHSHGVKAKKVKKTKAKNTAIPFRLDRWPVGRAAACPGNRGVRKKNAQLSGPA
jgi:hypothetical protein